MATPETINEVVNLLFDTPLADKPKPEKLQATTRVFAATLRDIDDALLRAAVVQHIGTCKWFPTVADIRESAVTVMRLTDDTPDAYTAWGQIKRQLRGGGEAHPLAIKAINALGGIREFGVSDVDDEPSWRAQFIRAYDTYRQRENEDAMMLPAVAGYIQQRKELGGQSIAGLISDVTKQLTGAR